MPRESRTRSSSWLLAGLVAGPLLLLVGINAASTLVDLADPCTVWGVENDSALAPGSGCDVRKGHSATRVELVAARVSIDGMLAYGAVAGLVAVARQNAALAALGTAALLFVAVPLFVGAFGAIAVLFALVLLALTRRLSSRSSRPGERAVATAFAAVLLLLAVLLLVVVLGGPTPHALLAMFAIAALFGGLIVRAHWPIIPPGDAEDPRPPSL